MQRIIVSILLSLVCMKAFSQHEAHDQHEEVHPSTYHKLSLVMANSLITNSVDRNNEILIVPTFGVNYDYWFQRKWAIGLHTDLVLQQYKVELHHDERILERENPVALCAMVSYQIIPRWAIMGGYGIELERNENINLFRFGLEYGIPLKDHWELAFTLEYDHKIKAYSSVMFGVVFSKLLFAK